MGLLLKGGEIVDPEKEEIYKADLLVEDGRIARVAPDISGDGHDTLDVSGKFVCPGFIDIHVHLREPGQEYKENVESGLRAAVKGGFTSVMCMPNTNPPIDNQATVKYLKERAAQVGLARLYIAGCITKGRHGEELAEIGEMVKEGILAITDDGDGVQDALIARRALEYSQIFGIPVMEHCEDDCLAQDGVMNEGFQSTLIGLRGMPKSAEDVMAARDIMLTQDVGGSCHITHISGKRSLDLVREAKKKGLKVSCDVTPHHLTLTDEAIVDSFDTRLKINPPLRTEEDRQAMLEGLVSGDIGIIATDHAPHADYEKDTSFEEAPFGAIGMESAFPVLLTKLVYEKHITLPKLVKAMTLNPARLLGLEQGRIAEGAPADLTALDIDTEYVLNAVGFESKSANCPFDGWEVKGKAIHVLVGGKAVVRDGEIV